MNLEKKELEKELKHLSDTIETAKAIIHEKELQQDSIKNEIVKSKKHLWQNKNEYSSVETFATMNEEDLNTNIINESQNKIIKLYRSLFSPYFGKVTFKSGERLEDIYVGLTGIEKDGKNFTYDWRAPISNLYYNYDVGASSYMTPDGMVEGENVNKRQFKISSGHLQEAFDTDVTIEDDLLQEALLTNNSDKMKNIVSTIQKEQNAIIRYTKKNDLIIEGIAGSGKTSVAMHRIAYLLYNDKNLTNKNVLIISPSMAFTNYISNILPDLGEEAVPTVTLAEFVNKYIPLSISNEEEENDINKYKPEYVDILDKRLSNYYKTLSFKSKLGLKKMFMTSIELNEIFKKDNRLTSIYNRIDYVITKICDLYDISYEKNHGKLEESIKKMLSIPLDNIDLYKKVMQTNENPATLPSYITALYLYFEINGYPNTAHIKHVVIDEVQDYSYMSLILIKKIFNSAQFTLLGDVHQSINGKFKYSTLEDIKNVFKFSEYIQLKKTYRSSYEIIEYTNKILGISNIESIRKPVGIPVLEKTGSLKEAELELERLKKKYNRIAIIVRDEYLNECSKLLENKDTAFISENSLKRVLIVPFSTMKGLEFDAVIVYLSEKGKFNDDEKNLLYVACTRAVHELVVFNR